MSSKYQVTFPAEVKQVSSKKTASLDLEYRVVLATSDPRVLQLGVLDADVLLDVTVETQD